VAGTTPIFRVFVSSTFADLRAERDALQRDVFPRLRRLCARHGASFQPIDLRWGVSQEAGLEQLTMKICLAEIERCQRTTRRPNFMILLGDRYGWRPLPAEVPAAELDVLLSELGGSPRAGDRTDARLVRASYIRDANTRPPVYLLRPREQRGAQRSDEEWEATEARLYAALLGAAERAGLPDEAGLKYRASATEQEIQAGLFAAPGAAEHVLCFQRDATGLPAGGRAGAFVDLKPDGTPDGDAERRLGGLKARLHATLGPRLHRYDATWVGDGLSGDHLAVLCDDAYGGLSQMIRAELESVEANDEERAAHVFAAERTRFFVGRAAPLAAIQGYLDEAPAAPVGAPPPESSPERPATSPEERPASPLLVWGRSGTGKSALLARAALLNEQAQPAAEVVMRFIGATAGSSDIRFLLDDLGRTVARRYGTPEPAPSRSFEELVQAFSARLDLATAERPLLLFLDALDQLGDADNARGLAWLPERLPPHVRLVVTTTEGECLEALRQRLAADHVVALDAMAPAEGGELFDLWLAADRRAVQPAQRDVVLGAFAACPYPLYLRLAFEAARTWRSYDEVDALPPTVAGVISDLFARLSREANHGPLLTSRVLGYLTASRFGLSEEEILGVLAHDDRFCEEFFADSPFGLPEGDGALRQIPVVLWSRLFFDLSPYLTERDQEAARLLTWYHRQLDEVARDEYLSAAAAAGERHTVLASFFRRQADPAGGGTWSGESPRGLSELPYHLTEARDWDALTATLTDFSYLETKLASVGVTERVDAEGDTAVVYEGVYQLLDDYRFALERFPADSDPNESAASEGGAT
jgi:NACHT domain- and WD repeat-containing protein